MLSASGHNYWNSSFVMDVAVGRYHVPQNAFLVITDFLLNMRVLVVAL